MSKLTLRMPNAWYTPQLYSSNKLPNMAELSKAMREMATKIEKTHLDFKADPASLTIWPKPSLVPQLLELDSRGTQIDLYA